MTAPSNAVASAAPANAVASAGPAAVSRGARRILAAMALTVIAVRLPLLDATTYRDEGMYGYIAQDLLRGYLPLETALDNKGPLLFFEYALGLALGGLGSIEGVRALGLLFVLGSGAALFALAREMRDETFALVATGLYAFHANLVQLYGHFCGSEVFTLTPALLAMWLGWKAPRAASAWPALLSGLMLGLAVWTRLTVATWGLALGLFLLWRAPRPVRAGRAAAMILGFGLVSALFIGLYSWPGKLGILSEAFLAFPSVQLATSNAFITEGEQFREAMRVFLPQTVMLWLPVLVLLCHPRRLAPEARWFLLPWFAVSVWGFYATHLYLLQQLLLVLPAAYLLAAWQLQDWARSARSGPLWKNGVAWLVLLCVGYSLATNAQLYRGLANRDPVYPLLSQGAKVADWVRENTAPDDFIYVWGVEWEVYFEAERRAPTRHLNLLLLVMFGVAVENGAPYGAKFDQMQKEVIAGLEAHPPEIVVLTAGVKNYDLKSYYLPGYFDAMLREDYDLLFQEEPYWVFRRKAAANG